MMILEKQLIMADTAEQELDQLKLAYNRLIDDLNDVLLQMQSDIDRKEDKDGNKEKE